MLVFDLCYHPICMLLKKIWWLTWQVMSYLPLKCFQIVFAFSRIWRYFQKRLDVWTGSQWEEIIVEKWEFLRKRLRPCLRGPKWKGTFFWRLFEVPQLPLWHHRFSLRSFTTARLHCAKKISIWENHLVIETCSVFISDRVSQISFLATVRWRGVFAILSGSVCGAGYIDIIHG